MRRVASGFASVIFQIMLLDLVFSFDSVITAVGIADHVEVMIAAVIIAIVVMMLAAEPISAFVEKHASTKMLALAFLVMVGMALIADGMHFHVERGVHLHGDGLRRRGRGAEPLAVAAAGGPGPLIMRGPCQRPPERGAARHCSRCDHFR